MFWFICYGLRSQVQPGRVAWPPGAAVRWTRGPSRLTPICSQLCVLVHSVCLSLAGWLKRLVLDIVILGFVFVFHALRSFHLCLSLLCMECGV